MSDETRIGGRGREWWEMRTWPGSTADEVNALLDSAFAIPAYQKALHMDQAWPATDVLRRLAEAARHFLGTHACDTLGHEEIRRAWIVADQIAAELSALSAVSGAK